MTNAPAALVDNLGSGYSTAPNVVIRDGTLFDPLAHPDGNFTQAADLVIPVAAHNLKKAPLSRIHVF